MDPTKSREALATGPWARIEVIDGQQVVMLRTIADDEAPAVRLLLDLDGGGTVDVVNSFASEADRDRAFDEMAEPLARRTKAQVDRALAGDLTGMRVNAVTMDDGTRIEFDEDDD